jgi:hypothetical protein
MSAAASLVSNVVIAPQPNTGGTARTAHLTITAEDVTGVKTITVTQSSKESLVVVPPSDPVPADGGIVTFTVESNKPWTIIPSTSFVSGLDKASGDGGDNSPQELITLTVPANPGRARSGTLTVKTEFEEFEFTINQGGIYLEMADDPTRTAIEIPVTNVTATVAINASTSWTVEVPTEHTAWLSAEAPDQQTLVINSSSNFKSFEGEVILKSTVNPEVTVTFTVKQNGVFPKGNAAAPYVTQDAATGWLTLTGVRPNNTSYVCEANFPYHYTGIYTWNFESINYPYTVGGLQCRMRHIDNSGNGASPGYYFTWDPANSGRLRASGTNISDYFLSNYLTWATSGQIRRLQIKISGETNTVTDFYVDGVNVHTSTRTDDRFNPPSSFRLNMDFMVSTVLGSLDYEVILKSMTWEPLE